MKIKIYCISALLIFSSVKSFSQDDLLDLAEKQKPEKKEYTIATFKYTRLVNCQTSETLGRRTLDVLISHRFGNINSGEVNLWGLDGPANIRLALEYSYNGRLMIGVGRNSYQKMFDSFLKFRLLRQTVDGSMPLSVTWFSGMYYTARPDPNKIANGFDRYEHRSSRFSYAHQLIIARKFSTRLSLQVAPVFVHYNQVEKIREKNDSYALSAAVRFKITKRFTLASEYTYRLSTKYSTDKYYDSFGVGIEIETGGHVFQIHVTNSFGIVENQFIPYTETKWDNVGIRLGYNMSRVFTLPAKKSPAKQ